MFNVDDRGIRKLETDLNKFKERAVPFAVRDTLNRTIFDARRESIGKVRTDMVLRNKFTERSIQVDRARGLNVQTMEAVVGSTLDYMEDQEFGATKTSRGKRGVPIPTTTASGEGEGGRPRRKVPRAANRLARVKLSKRTGGGFKSRKQETFLRIKATVEAGKRFLYLNTGRKQAIYRVQGRGRVNKQGRITGIKMKMVYDLSRRSVTINRNPWLKPSTDISSERIPEFYRRSLTFQLKRLGLFSG